MQGIFRIAIVTCLGLLTSPLLHGQEPAKPAAKTEPGNALLGVKLAWVHPAFSAQLKDVLAPEQGLLVDRVEDKSPAAAAGIRVHDILVAYDDQKLYSAAQLVKVVHADQPGREVTITLIREGKLQKIKVKLGTKPPPPALPGRIVPGAAGAPGAAANAAPPSYPYYYPQRPATYGAPLPGTPAYYSYFYGSAAVGGRGGGGAYDTSDDTGFYGYGL